MNDIELKIKLDKLFNSFWDLAPMFIYLIPTDL